MTCDGSCRLCCQIAEELNESGRRVYLCVGRAARRPRRYRGKDFMFWAVSLGRVEQTADQLPSPSARFAANPQLSGKDGGHTLNLHLSAAIELYRSMQMTFWLPQAEAALTQVS